MEQENSYKKISEELAELKKLLLVRDATANMMQDLTSSKYRHEKARAELCEAAEKVWKDVALRRHGVLEKTLSVIDEAINHRKDLFLVHRSHERRMKIAELEALKQIVEKELGWAYGEDEV